MYTLQQCFEMSGSKFPFYVSWKNNYYSLKCDLKVFKNIKITKKIVTNYGSTQWCWKNATLEKFFNDYFDGFATMPDFVPKIIEDYKNDFETLLK